jgi:hypothetical protein
MDVDTDVEVGPMPLDDPQFIEDSSVSSLADISINQLFIYEFFQNSPSPHTLESPDLPPVLPLESTTLDDDNLDLDKPLAMRRPNRA